jgi:hypothetical protein
LSRLVSTFLVVSRLVPLMSRSRRRGHCKQLDTSSERSSQNGLRTHRKRRQIPCVLLTDSMFPRPLPTRLLRLEYDTSQRSGASQNRKPRLSSRCRYIPKSAHRRRNHANFKPDVIHYSLYRSFKEINQATCGLVSFRPNAKPTEGRIFSIYMQCTSLLASSNSRSRTSAQQLFV